MRVEVTPHVRGCRRELAPVTTGMTCQVMAFGAGAIDASCMPSTSSRRPDASSHSVQAPARWWIEEILLGSAVARAVGLELVDLAVDRVRLRLPFGEHLVTHGRTVHGGVIATAVDIAGSAASASGVRGEATGGATAILDLAYIRAIEGVDVFLDGHVDFRTENRTVSVVQVRDDDHTYARATVDSRVFRPRS